MKLALKVNINIAHTTSTIEAPKITPGSPKIKICTDILISSFKDLTFNEPPSPNATVANLWLARAWK